MRVLVVEDEVNLATAVADGLRAEGYEVEVSHDGNDGLWRAQEGQFDAILLDIMLPGMNGYRVCDTLRKEDIWTPILMLTAKDGEYDEAEGLDTGADDYLTKPFSLVVLLARLRALIRRGNTVRPALLAVGDLQLDPSTHECRRGSESIALTPREFAVLEALALHPERVVTKQELIDRVWGLDYFGPPNIVEVYVGYLRKKVDRPFGIDSIKTVRGIGYRLGA
ncbi:MAG: response regulator transcription factor [Acidimicrobiia bacterium]|nr:response regulator transcription factor [Acidimicrobiia bacterium]MDX2467578.1 response regulator transcription factor [Acidimicrobiia bacterium]